MPRPSLLQTPIARLRSITGEHVATFAKILQISESHLWKLESNKKPLPEELAIRIQKETAISANWLLAGKVNALPVDDMNDPYTVETYERRRAALTTDRSYAIPFEHIGTTSIAPGARVAAIYESALGKRDELLFEYKLARALDALEKEFGSKSEIKDAKTEEALALKSLKDIFHERREFHTGQPLPGEYDDKSYEVVRAAFFQEFETLSKKAKRASDDSLPEGPGLFQILEMVAVLAGLKKGWWREWSPGVPAEKLPKKIKSPKSIAKRRRGK